MADVVPFRAVRYAEPRPSVVAPPYDVVDADEREALRLGDAHNVAHLTLESDPDAAATTYRTWLDSGVLVREAEPAVWLLEQEFVDPAGARLRRLAVLGALRAEPYESGAVLPHERTHAGPIRSRLALLRAVRAQLEPLFFLVEGPLPFVAPERDPTIEADGVRVWRCRDGEAATRFFADRQLLIADGHHRYETALAYAAGSGRDPLVLAAIVSADDPGLEIIATHRVFAGRADIAVSGDPCEDIEDALHRLAAAPENRAAAVFYAPSGFHLVTGDTGELDVELVDRYGVAGISYTVDPLAAVSAVDGGAADCAFLVRPTAVSNVFAWARAGRVLPQKATHFFPKLPSGLLFLPLEDR